MIAVLGNHGVCLGTMDCYVLVEVEVRERRGWLERRLSFSLLLSLPLQYFFVAILRASKGWRSEVLSGDSVFRDEAKLGENEENENGFFKGHGLLWDSFMVSRLVSQPHCTGDKVRSCCVGLRYESFHWPFCLYP